MQLIDLLNVTEPTDSGVYLISEGENLFFGSILDIPSKYHRSNVMAIKYKNRLVSIQLKSTSNTPTLEELGFCFESGV
ncbi:hypothetical protein [Lunatimonas salinarum]|uniref:hypothetical protein n=1 Tax=Lunatimonas salinarum TaxID=1774590 RepID=UPI001AE013E3|nr:hypothetical protein [Lunatimonas salinarum]